MHTYTIKWVCEHVCVVRACVRVHIHTHTRTHANSQKYTSWLKNTNRKVGVEIIFLTVDEIVLPPPLTHFQNVRNAISKKFLTHSHKPAMEFVLVSVNVYVCMMCECGSQYKSRRAFVVFVHVLSLSLSLSLSHTHTHTQTQTQTHTFLVLHVATLKAKCFIDEWQILAARRMHTGAERHI